jgi:hypothetical protein
MAGLLSGAAPGGMEHTGGGTPRGQEMDGAGDVAGAQPNVTPEEQAQYEEFVNNAFSIIYDRAVFPTILQRLKATPDPVEGLAAVTVMVVSYLQTTARQQNAEVGPDILMHGGMAILEDLAETAAKAGVHDYTSEEIEAATYRAMDIYRETEEQQGGLHKEAIAQDWSALVQANRTGELDKAFPGLAEHFARRQGGDNPQEEAVERPMPPGEERMEERRERRGLMPMQGRG